MISALLILNSRGEVLVSRTFREDVVIRSAAEAFKTQIISTKLGDRSPIRQVGSLTFMHVLKNNLYMVAVTRRNANTAGAFAFLNRLMDIFKAYFGGVYSEDTVRANYVLIYELLDEVMDYGYPQTMEIDVLKMYVNSEGEGGDVTLEDSSKITIQATGAITWRRDGIRYKRNEVFLDVIEQVNALISNSGAVLNANVAGQVMMKSYLSGMPECKFGLNDKMVSDSTHAGHASSTTSKRGAGIEIDDITFHQCVKLGRFDADRTISFVPPDGEFELMRYRITDNIILPFKMMPPIVRELGRTRLEVQVTVKATFSTRLFATNVVIKIPCPPNTANTKLEPTAGKAKYDPETSCIVWKIRRFPGGAEYSLSGEVNLISTTSGKNAWARPPISFDFQVPMFTASGLLVRFLKVFEKSNYQTIKWVRYITKAGSYQNRI
jgi:AP-2 complex subunit mu-1